MDVKDSLIWKDEAKDKDEEEAAVARAEPQKTTELSEIANDSIRMYLCEIGRVRLLTGKEEIDLAKRIRKGDQTAKQKLAELEKQKKVKSKLLAGQPHWFAKS